MSVSWACDAEKDEGVGCVAGVMALQSLDTPSALYFAGEVGGPGAWAMVRLVTAYRATVCQRRLPKGRTSRVIRIWLGGAGNPGQSRW
jgi:hypothetical protein